MKKVQLGKNILILVIAETVTDDCPLDLGLLDMMIEDFRVSCLPVDAAISEMDRDD